MQIIGIAGQLGNGKDVLGERLKQTLEERFGDEWFHRSWASGLKNVFYDAFNVTKEFSEEWKRNPEMPPGFDMTVRGALQQIGDGFRQIKGDVWIDWTLRRSPNKTFITDCRYPNELKRIREEGGINILVIRPTHINDVDHPSEAHLRPIVDWFADYEGPVLEESITPAAPPGVEYIDYVIRNDSTILEFNEKIDGGLVSFVKEKFDLHKKKKRRSKYVYKKIDNKELSKINDRMRGWVIDGVDSGQGENVFIFNLSKGSGKRQVILCANDLGGWFGR